MKYIKNVILKILGSKQICRKSNLSDLSDLSEVRCFANYVKFPGKHPKQRVLLTK